MNLQELLPKGLTLTLTEGRKAEVSVQHRIPEPGELEVLFERFLQALGLDKADQNLEDTPERVTRMWTAWTAPEVVKLTAYTSPSQTPVLIKDHLTVSICPHHLLPFQLRVHVGYQPNGRVVGLSKLPRLVDLVSKSLMLQEHIPEVVCEVLDRLLNPKGVYCRAEGVHGCMQLRGVRTPGKMICEAERGWVDRVKELANGHG